MAINSIFRGADPQADPNGGKLTISRLIAALVGSKLSGTALTNATGVISQEGIAHIDIPRPDYEAKIAELESRIAQMQKDKEQIKAANWQQDKLDRVKYQAEAQRAREHNESLVREVAELRKAVVYSDPTSGIGGVDFGKISFREWLVSTRKTLGWDVDRMILFLDVSKKDYLRWENSPKCPSRIRMAGARALIASLKQELRERFETSGRWGQRVDPAYRAFLGLSPEGLKQEVRVDPEPGVESSMDLPVEPGTVEAGTSESIPVS